MFSVFYMTFLNYAIVPLLAPWDSREFVLPFLNNFLFKNGLYTDINSAWFQESGALICATMYSNAFWPIIEFSYTFGLRLLFRALD